MIQKGFDACVEAATSKTTQMLKIKAGESKRLRIIQPLKDVIGLWEHVVEVGDGWKTIACTGKSTCPICKRGKNPSYKVYLVVLDKTDNQVKVFKISKDLATTLSQLSKDLKEADGNGDLTTRDIKISRQGSGMNDTKYTPFTYPVSEEDTSKYELPDVESMIMVLSPEEIIELMSGSTEKTGETKTDEFPF